LFSLPDPTSLGRPVALILATLLLAGCSLAQSPSAPGTSRSNDSGATAAIRPQPAATTQPRRAAPRATLADLMGAEPARIDNFLGLPEIVRREGTGELRLYRSETCVVHVFLYPRSGVLTAAHIEARSETARLDANQTESCIASFS